MNTGGPAFPCGALGFEGMSMRQWYAGQVLVGQLWQGPNCYSDMECRLRAEFAFKQADAMIAENEKEKS